eukprot:GILK01007779.1.p1 GENE.GILK01007779.1~~GILK01007779.1.p1  ORF type:complete len:131 (-),score=31.88 GILK01007779.1:104-496(-)
MATQEEEDAAELKLGPDFTNAKCLMNSEIAIVLEHRQANPGVEDIENPVFDKTLAYVNRFNRYRNKEAVKQVRELLQKKNLEDFEIAALGNLNPEDAEEAKSLIPSLSRRVEDDSLNAILDDLRNFRKYT